MMVEVNVFVMLRHVDQFGGLVGSVVEYVIIDMYRCAYGLCFAL
jgi:hypothetical protein